MATASFEESPRKSNYNDKDDGGSSFGVEVIEVTQEERRLVHRLDRRILPIACLMYLFACV